MSAKDSTRTMNRTMNSSLKGQYEERKIQLLMKIQTASSFSLKKETSNLFRSRESQQKRQLIDVSAFTHVLSVTKKYVEVEGMTTYETLVDKTLKHGVMPTVVPELKSITVGGAVAGIGIESSSIKYGLVHEGVIEMEILLPSGKVITTSREKNKDLFYAFPNSYGTLGYALKLKMMVVPVKPYVKLNHFKILNKRTFFEQIHHTSSNWIDFFDGTIFSPTEFYLTEGSFVDTLPDGVKLSDYTGNNIYYKSIRHKTNDRKTDYLTTKDYIWRWDTDWFWCSMHFGVQHPLIRFFIPKRLLRSVTYHHIMMWSRRHPLVGKILTIIGGKRESIIQDVSVPMDKAREFFTWYCEHIKIFPVWICPFKGSDEFSLFTTPKKRMINFGFWDTIETNHPQGYFNRLIELKIEELGGRKSLYSDSFYPKEKFDKLYNGALYKKMKRKYDPQHKAKGLYEKCVLRN